jgi:hypothetical protein
MKSFQPAKRWLSFSDHGAQTPVLPMGAGEEKSLDRRRGEVQVWQLQCLS